MIYLDNAATSWPKPERCTQEMVQCLRSYCGNPGRSSHRMSMEAARKLYECRTVLAQLFGSDDPECVVFTYNATYALNIAIKAFAAPGAHIVISNLEHNAVLRPVAALRKKQCDYSVFNALGTEEQVLHSFCSVLRPTTKIAVVTHASNICGQRIPIATIGRYCSTHGIILIVDASQSAGCVPINMERDHIDILCAPGHKGLYGPQGTGFLIIGKRLHAMETQTLIEGGSGFHSEDLNMPATLPERFEAGTLATPALAGLCESVKWVGQIGVDTIGAQEREIGRRFTEMLRSIQGVTLYGCTPETEAMGSSVLLFNFNDFAPSAVGEELDRAGICVRSGLHCAPLAHRTLGTGADGAVRVSIGYYNRMSDADALWRTLRRMQQ